MKRIEIKKLFLNAKSFSEQQITVCGWLRTVRDSKSIGFLELNDGSSFRNLQVVLEAGKVENFAEVVKFNVGAAVSVTGRVLLTPQAKQPLEIHAETVTLEGASAPEYPLQKKRHSLEYLRSIAHLRPRTNTFEAVFRVRSVAAFNGFRPVGSGKHGFGFWKSIYFWPHLPGRKFQYSPPCSGILDD